MPDNYYVVDTTYAITIMPNDTYQFAGQKDRLRKFHKFMFTFFMDFPCDYDFVTELSEPRGMILHHNTGSRLHLHGVIRFKHKKEIGIFLTHWIYKFTRIGNIDIDTVGDLDIWFSYMHKQHLLKDKRFSNSFTKSQCFSAAPSSKSVIRQDVRE